MKISMSILLFFAAAIFLSEGVVAQKTEDQPKEAAEQETAADKVAEAQKKLDEATAELGKAKKAYEDAKEKWFGPPDTEKWGEDLKSLDKNKDLHGKAKVAVDEIEAAKKDFNTAVETANDFKAKGDKEGFEGWQDIAKARAETVLEKQRAYDDMVKEELKEIDKQNKTRVVDDLKKAESDLERAEKALNEAEDEAKKPERQKTKAEPKKKPPAGETGLESSGEAAPGKEVSKDDCDGLKEKIRTLQDSLRKRQAEPATPKEELVTIRKQIDDLLERLANCPKQEPIDAQFDCLKSKFPGIQRSSNKKDAASDPTSKREFAWDNDKQAWIDKDTKESICPPSEIDACLVGTWECISFKPDAPYFTGGGAGFRVTFKSDGTETIDYSSMRPLRVGSQDADTFIGKASAKISTNKGAAKIEEGKQTADLGLTLVKILTHGERAKCPGLGPGGLGSAKDNNSYKCTEDSLEYQTTWLGAVYPGHHRQSYTVKLKKVKP